MRIGSLTETGYQFITRGFFSTRSINDGCAHGNIVVVNTQITPQANRILNWLLQGQLELQPMDLFWFWWGATHDVGQHVWSWPSRPQEASSEVGSGTTFLLRFFSFSHARQAEKPQWFDPISVAKSLSDTCPNTWSITLVASISATLLTSGYEICHMYLKVLPFRILTGRCFAFCLFVFWLVAPIWNRRIRSWRFPWSYGAKGKNKRDKPNKIWVIEVYTDNTLHFLRARSLGVSFWMRSLFMSTSACDFKRQPTTTDLCITNLSRQ